MAEAFTGEIRAFAGNYAPQDWAFCDGQTLPIAAYSALFSLIGDRYGGDGRTTFCLPDLRGRTPVGQGQGPGLSPQTVGNQGGAEAVAVALNELPTHRHALGCSSQPGNQAAPEGGVPAVENDGTAMYGTGDYGAMHGSSLVGSNGKHENMQPWLALRFVICLEGIYPARG